MWAHTNMKLSKDKLVSATMRGKIFWHLLPSAVLLASALAACSSGERSALIPGVDPSTKKATSTSNVFVYVTIPQQMPSLRKKGVRKHYVSPATQSIAITISLPTGRAKRVNSNLTPSTNKKCTASADGIDCELSFSLAAGSYTASFATYDGLLIGGQPSGRELSANQTVSFTVRAKKSTQLHIALDGIPTGIAFLPSATSSLYGNQSLGYVMPRCSPAPQGVNVVGVDADGNYILGPGSPTVKVISGSSSLTVSAPKSSAPTLFTLTPPSPPAYVPAGSTVYLEAAATPAAKSGKTAAVAIIVKITFSGDVCGAFTEYSIPTSNAKPLGITVGPDGAIWFTEYGASKIGRIPTTATAANPQITEYPTPTGNAGPEEIASGPDGGLWFSECFTGQIGRITPGSASMLEFTVPSPVSKPRGIVAGADNAMWFTESGTAKIGRIPVNGPVSINEYSVPTAGSKPTAATLGPDGAVWFMEAGTANVGRINTNGAVTEYPTGAAGTLPRDITVGPDDNIWFTECAGLNAGKVPPGGSPVTTYQVASSYSGGYGITAGPDGALWFAQANSFQIGRITTDGNVAQYTIPTVGGQPRFIVKAPDGSLWFTEFLGNKIGRLQ